MVWRFDRGRVSGLRAGLPPGVGWVVHVLQIHLGLHWCVISNSYAVLSKNLVSVKLIPGWSLSAHPLGRCRPLPLNANTIILQK